MGVNKLAIISWIVVASIFLLNPSVINAASTEDEVENEREFNYDNGGEIGPENWGKIHKDWAVCGDGKMQSPIDLSDNRVAVLPHLGRLKRSYRAAQAVLKNRGHDIMLEWGEDAGFIHINGTRYNLKQLHWHSPSEHTINGNRYVLELHMVHESTDKKIAVVGTLYTIGRHDPFLAKLEGSIDRMRDVKDAEEKVGTVDPRNVRRGSRKYYRYMGSLTVPPCTEGVVWTILKKARTVSRKQVKLLRDAVHDDFDMNARPVQKMNDRLVAMYRPRKEER